MDYKELAEYLERRGLSNPSTYGHHSGLYEQAATAITDLLARAEAAEARVHELETLHRTEMCESGYDCVELGKVRKELEEAEARANAAEKERDAAIQYMRKMFGWCTGCVHFTGIYGSGCKIGEMSTCGEENSHYVFGKEE